MTYHGDDTPISDAMQAAGRAAQGTARPRLLDELRSRLRLKHYSLKTERAYVYWIRRYIHANGRRHPRELDGVAVERFLSLLATRDQVAASTQNQALSALLFLYKEVLGIALPWMENVVRAKRPRRLPVVLSKGETAALMRQLSGREALMAGLLYGSGLRLMECVRLRIKDVDLERNEITVRDGKGGKDRRTVLPASLREALRLQMDAARLTHARDLEAGSVRCGCRTPWRASIRTRRNRPYGNTCSPPRDGRPIRAMAASGGITSTKRACNARYRPPHAPPASTSP